MLKKFYREREIRIKKQFQDKKFQKLSNSWTKYSLKNGYIYNFSWLGIPIIKYPSDIITIQEIIFEVKPDLIIETGVAHGGSLAFYASIQKIYNQKAKTIGIEIDFRKHNKKNCEKIYKQLDIKVIEGSSISNESINKLKKYIKGKKKIMVILDSDHSNTHVFKELNIYSKIVSKGSYLVCTDTIVDFMPKGFFLTDWQKKRAPHRNFDKGTGPFVAVKQFLKINKNYKIDTKFHAKSTITENPHGFLKKIK